MMIDVMMMLTENFWLWSMAVLLLLAGWSNTAIIVVVAFVAPVKRMLFSSTPTFVATWPTTAPTTESRTRTPSGGDVTAFVQTNIHWNEMKNNNDDSNHHDAAADDDDTVIHDTTTQDNYDLVGSSMPCWGFLDQNNNNNNNNNNNVNDALLNYSIDSFLRGDYYYYDRPFELFEDDDDDDYNSVAPLPGLSPVATVEQALRVLRKTTTTTTITLNHGNYGPSHSAACCFLRFCVPLRRRERWSTALPSYHKSKADTTTPTVAWKEILRESLTPTMFVRRLRASQEFSILLDWDILNVTEGGKEDFAFEGTDSTVSIVKAAFYFGNSDGGGKNQKGINDSNNISEETVPPELFQIRLNRVGGVWLIDSITRMPKCMFQNTGISNHDGEENRFSHTHAKKVHKKK
jgi:hypothetical protein